MKLITGKKGEAHITPKQDSAFHKAYAGATSGVFDFKLPTASVDSATSFTLGEMELMVQGRWCIIEAGETETISIGSTAGAGQSRIDLLVAKITPNTDETQSIEWELVQGESTDGTPTIPTYDQGDLDSGTVGRYAVWKITVGATAITNIELVAERISAGMRLLWENPSPSNQWVGASVDGLDFGSCRFVRVFFRSSTTETVCWVQDALIGDEGGSNVTKTWAKVNAASQKFGIVVRQFKAVNGSVQFSAPEQIHWEGNTNRTIGGSASDPTHLIPYKIYAY